MNKLVLLFVFMIGFYAMGQDANRIKIKGKVIVEKSDVEGIPIINKTSKAMVFTDELGNFLLDVKLNDSIEVKALQYQNISFKVNEAVIRSGIMKIYLIEEVYKLDEVFVSSSNLTGNLAQDVKTTRAFQPKLGAFYFGIPNSEFTVMDGKTATRNELDLDESHNVAMNPERLNMINGLDIVNVVDLVLLPLFRSGTKSNNESTIPKVPAESIKYYFGSEFLVDNFNIPEHRVEEFVRFVGEGDFDYTLLNYGNEIEFLEFINQKSKQFLNGKE